MGHSTSSGRASGGASQPAANAAPAAVTPERRAALSFNQRAQAIRDMVFEEYGSGSRAEIPGVGRATVTYNDVTESYEGGFYLEREGTSHRVFGNAKTLRQMETRVRIAMENFNRRGNVR